MRFRVVTTSALAALLFTTGLAATARAGPDFKNGISVACPTWKLLPIGWIAPEWTVSSPLAVPAGYSSIGAELPEGGHLHCAGASIKLKQPIPADHPFCVEGRANESDFLCFDADYKNAIGINCPAPINAYVLVTDDPSGTWGGSFTSVSMRGRKIDDKNLTCRFNGDPGSDVKRLIPPDQPECHVTLDGSGYTCFAPGEGVDPTLNPAAQYQIPVLAVRMADDDGEHASALTRGRFQVALNEMNDLFAYSGLNVHLSVDPQSQFDSVLKSTLMNYDCTPVGADESVLTNPDPAADGDDITDKDEELICSSDEMKKARMAYAAMYPSSLVVFFRRENSTATWNDKAVRWEVRAGPYNYSGPSINFIASHQAAQGENLTHEAGHYLYLPHTFAHKPQTMDEAAELITKYVDKHKADPGFDIKADATRAFDLDRKVGILDTPPDPGLDLFKAVFGGSKADACEVNNGSIVVPAMILQGISWAYYTFTVEPDRSNMMSYFHCPMNGIPDFSPMQIARMKGVLEGTVPADGAHLDRTALGRLDILECAIQHGVRVEHPGWSIENVIGHRFDIVHDCLYPPVDEPADPTEETGKGKQWLDLFQSLSSIRACKESPGTFEIEE